MELVDVFAVDTAVLIAMEYLQQSLSEVLKNIDKPLSLSQIKLYTKMTLKGVEAMHSNRIMHRVNICQNNLLNYKCF